MKKKLKRDGNIYLIVDPALGEKNVVPKLIRAIEAGVDIVQVWDHWSIGQKKEHLMETVCTIAERYHIPAMINNDWSAAVTFPFDGVHFDSPVTDLADIQRAIKREILIGVTCGNNLETAQWAVKHRLDYISFCSMFPTPSGAVCEYVAIETVQTVRSMTNIPIFLAGGITLENIELLNETGMNGIVLISAIMNSDDPTVSVSKFKERLKNK